MQTVVMDKREIGRRGESLYAQHVRSQVETADNLGKMVIIDIASGDYEVGDETGIEAAQRLSARHANAIPYGIRIGYTVGAALGGVMERTTP